ncbi:MAG: hypothetical protein JWP95_1204 [Actinotalea sp.]|nr:hypothetical protein [Actinotalea sp.]
MKRSGILFMFGLAIVLVLGGLVWVFVLPDGGRSRLGLDRDGAGWLGVASGAFLFVAATIESRKDRN